jgi:hypothetical protein
MSGSTTERRTAVSRPLVGIIALALLGTWAVIGLLQLTGTVDSEDARLRMWWAAFGRVGLVMLAFWLALPSPGRPAAWAKLSKPMLIALILAVVLVTISPAARRLAIPLLAVLAIASLLLRPRAKRRPGRPGATE